MEKRVLKKLSRLYSQDFRGILNRFLSSFAKRFYLFFCQEFLAQNHLL